MFKVGQRVKAHLGENFMADDIQTVCIGKVGTIVRVFKRQEMCYQVQFEGKQRIYLCADEVSPVAAKVV